MIKKTLFLGNPCYLSKKNNQLIVEFPDKEKDTRSIPIEDIGMIIAESHRITFTNSLIAALMENNAAIVSCDSFHMPFGLMLPMASHHAFTEKLYAQLDSSEPLRKNLWQQTVVAKIRNQAFLLGSTGVNIDNMVYWASRVRSGDPDNYEARAAAYYWDNIYGADSGFKRHRFGAFPNNLSNYGYAVLRAIVARSLVGSGLFPALGIHHRNKYNPYCLADDIMEPYRPFVDSLVIEIMQQEGEVEELTTAHKVKLLSIATVDTVIEKQRSPLMVGVQRTTASVRKCFDGEIRKIAYPEFSV